MELLDIISTPYLAIPELALPKPEVVIESLEVEDLVTMHAKLLYELQYLPRGTLAVRRRGQRVYYSQQTTVNHVRQDRYLSLRQDAIVIEILKKKKLIRSTLTRIRKASRHLRGYRRRLAAKLAIIDRRHADNYMYYTNKIYVCSTAEAAIVEMLHKHHVKFEYAPPTYIGGWIMHPDFKYMVDGRPVYHEHLGMLDNPSYVFDNLERINVFARNGIIIGNNLILTWETPKKPLTHKMINDKLRSAGIIE